MLNIVSNYRTYVQYSERGRPAGGSRPPRPWRTRFVDIQAQPFDPHTLGARIAALRQSHGWSQRRLADEAGVSNGYIALLELGRMPRPGKFRLDAVARAL